MSAPGMRSSRQRAAHGRGRRAKAAAPRSEYTNIYGEDVGPKSAPLKSLFPGEPSPPAPGAPKLRVAIVGGGLAALSTASELLDQGHEVEIFEQRKVLGGKMSSWQDRDGNHIEMGLHVFFGCYFNLFRLMARSGAIQNLLPKDHTHTFCNKDGDVRELDFRFLVGDVKIGAPFHGLKAFFTTPQLEPIDKAANALALGTSPIVRALVDPEGGMQDIRNLDDVSFADWFRSHGGSNESMKRMWDPIAYALGFLDCEDISARCMLTIFQFFATKTDASVLRMLAGSPDNYLISPIREYIEKRGGVIHTGQGCKEVLWEDGPDGTPVVKGLKINRGSKAKVVTADAYVAALDVPGAKRLIPQDWRRMPMFDKIFDMDGVPVMTVQLRYDGWVTEMKDPAKVKQLGKEHKDVASGIDNLLYSPDADFSCFADLALTSPWDYFKEGEGSLMQCVITPPGNGVVSGKDYEPLQNDKIIALADGQVRDLFPSARNLELKWGNVVKIGQSLYREKPGMDAFRPDQKTPISNFFLAGSYTKQDYIDSMEGATLSGRQCAARVTEAAAGLSKAAAKQTTSAAA